MVYNFLFVNSYYFGRNTRLYSVDINVIAFWKRESNRLRGLGKALGSVSTDPKMMLER